MTIHFGEKKIKRSEYTAKVEKIAGFYFICNDQQGDEHRYWMGETFNEAFRAFDAMGDKYLGSYNKYNYWIDYCSGYDVDRRLAWSNLDHSDRFVDEGTY